jgi:hypothetical protein
VCFDADSLHSARPVFEAVSGWKADPDHPESDSVLSVSALGMDLFPYCRNFPAVDKKRSGFSGKTIV